MPKIKELIQPPPEPEGTGEQQIAALRDYLVKITQELYYLLTHLEADNINDSTFKKISEMIPRPYVGLPRMDGVASAGQSGQWARGDHRHGSDTTKADVMDLEETAEDLADHIADKGNPHEVTKSQVGLGNVANERQYSAQNPPPIPTPEDVGAIPASEKGSAGGVAELDAGGRVPSGQLPSYVDDVLEYPTAANFPAVGESGKIYVDLAANLTYRWGGSEYAEISPSLALGETSSTAYRGDRGKIAYDHSQTTGNPHGTTAAEVGAAPVTAGIFPGTSSTAGGTQAKVGTVPNLAGLAELYDGLTICMTFDNAQLYDGQPTLNIGIPYNGSYVFGINRTAASAAGIYDWGQGSAVDLVFNAGSAVWVMKKGQHGSAVRYGVLLLSDSVSENSTVGGGKAATPAAVKTAYDLAAGKTATDVSYDAVNHQIKKTVDGVTSVVATADTTPTANSDNLVTSGGVVSAIDTALANVLQQEILLVQISAVTSLPVTVTDDLITVDHVVLEAELGDPQAQTSEWTATTTTGSVTISGSVSGTTSLKLILGKLNNPPE